MITIAAHALLQLLCSSYFALLNLNCDLWAVEILVSFNIESLFTKVPIDGAVQAALRKLESDSGLADRTTLTPAQIVDLLNVVLRST